MSEQSRQEKFAAVNTLNPQEETNLRECITKWNGSEFRKSKFEEAKETWEVSQSGVAVTQAKFNGLASFTKLELHNLNRDRSSAYDFSNAQYASKKPKYVPATTPAKEDEPFSRNFVPVPIGWNTDAPPTDNTTMEPSGWVITVMGDVPGMKKQEATAVNFTPKLKDLCDKYREVKDVFFKVSSNNRMSHRAKFINVKDLPDIKAGDKPFFVNAKQKPLGRI